MRSGLALAALLLGLSGCSSSLSQVAIESGPTYPPVRARILPPSAGQLAFHLSRPAYVAMFEIVPGAGVSMVYPGFGTGSLDGRAFSGINMLIPRRMNADQYLFASAGTQLQPRFFFLIASDRPLNVEQFGSMGWGLPRALRHHFASLNAYGTMEELALLTIPNLENEASWSTDVYVHWPEVIHREPARRLVRLTCDNGYTMYVPWAHVDAVYRQVCRAGQRTDQEQPRDSASTDQEITKPKPRKPALPEVPRKVDMEARALLERITASSQLEGHEERWRRPDDAEGDGLRPRLRPAMGAAAAGHEERRPSTGSAAQAPRAEQAGESAQQPKLTPRVRAEPHPRPEPREEPRRETQPKAEPRPEPPVKVEPRPTPTPQPAPSPPPSAERPRPQPSCDPCDRS